MAPQQTDVVSCRLEPKLKRELEQAAEDAGKSVNAYLHDLIAAAVHEGDLASLGGFDSMEDAYKDAAYKRAYHEARVAISRALDGMWPRKRG